MKKSLGFFLFATLMHGVRANLVQPDNSLASQMEFSEAEFGQRLRLIDEKIQQSQGNLREKARIFHSLSHGASPTQFAWQEESVAPQKRLRFRDLLKLAMRENIREIEALQEQRKDVNAEREWLQIQMSELIKIASLPVDSKSPKAKADFHCGSFPLQVAGDGQASLVQDFGSKKDSETGLEWRSLGWWFTGAGKDIVSCASGKVVYSGSVSGRGRVLMVDHGAGVMTLYANLSEESGEVRFRKGDRIKAAQSLGAPRERFYFEVRQNGVAVNPRVVLSTQNLSNLRIQGL